MMTEIDFPPFFVEGFSARASFADGVVHLQFEGAAELQIHDTLGPLLMKLHAEALRLNARKVEVDFGRLQFMNSSCFKRFVTWLVQVQQTRSYSVHFRSNPRIRWQKASLAALTCFAPEHVTVETMTAA